MKDEGYKSINIRRHGFSAFRRYKQWWYFEGLDTNQNIYYVFLALKGFPKSYISIKVIDFKNGKRWTEDYLTNFQAKSGNKIDVSAKGKWGFMKFYGQAENYWSIQVKTRDIEAEFKQRPLVPIHTNRLYTKYINYFITQFINNEMSGTLIINHLKKVQTYDIKGYGYCEHNWGVQPGHSTTHWLHFWSPTIIGIVMDCRYDAGIAHNYNYFWYKDKGFYLPSPSNFHYDPDKPMDDFLIQSPNLELKVIPIYSHFTRKKFWPILNIDYQELLLYIKGWIYHRGEEIKIDGIGKLDHNFNKW